MWVWQQMSRITSESCNKNVKRKTYVVLFSTPLTDIWPQFLHEPQTMATYSVFQSGCVHCKVPWKHLFFFPLFCATCSILVFACVFISLQHFYASVAIGMLFFTLSVPFLWKWYIKNAWRGFHYIWNEHLLGPQDEQIRFGGQRSLWPHKTRAWPSLKNYLLIMTKYRTKV